MALKSKTELYKFSAAHSTFGWWMGYLSKGNQVYYADIRGTNDSVYVKFSKVLMRFWLISENWRFETRRLLLTSLDSRESGSRYFRMSFLLYFLFDNYFINFVVIFRVIVIFLKRKLKFLLVFFFFHYVLITITWDLDKFSPNFS